MQWLRAVIYAERAGSKQRIVHTTTATRRALQLTLTSNRLQPRAPTCASSCSMSTAALRTTCTTWPCFHWTRAGAGCGGAPSSVSSTAPSLQTAMWRAALGSRRRLLSVHSLSQLCHVSLRAGVTCDVWAGVHGARRPGSGSQQHNAAAHAWAEQACVQVHAGMRYASKG